MYRWRRHVPSSITSNTHLLPLSHSDEFTNALSAHMANHMHMKRPLTAKHDANTKMNKTTKKNWKHNFTKRCNERAIAQVCRKCSFGLVTPAISAIKVLHDKHDRSAQSSQFPLSHAYARYIIMTAASTFERHKPLNKQNISAIFRRNISFISWQLRYCHDDAATAVEERIQWQKLVPVCVNRWGNMVAT